MIPDQGTKILKATLYGQSLKKKKKKEVKYIVPLQKKKKAGERDRKYQGSGRCWNFRAGSQGGGDNFFPLATWHVES